MNASQQYQQKRLQGCAGQQFQQQLVHQYTANNLKHKIMKKKIKVLTLNKKTVSDLQKSIKGGEADNASGGILCQTNPTPPIITWPADSCRDTVRNWCDSRFGGCHSYYC